MMEDNELFIAVMFPYPSGSGLHCGHWYNYAIMDSYCRYQRYIGKKVFQPFGYDSFGLPAENYARSVGREPKEVTEENIDRFQQQMDYMNTDYQFVLSTHQEYYKFWSSWLFGKLHSKGLAYKKDGEVDYCVSCETTLAREQVVNKLVETGISHTPKQCKDVCERCNTPIIKKIMNQWYFRITDYKARLIKNLESGKTGLPKETVNAQLRWLENQHDWCISRQRKWGCPIPVEGETDTMDTFVDSSFYFIIYCIMTGRKPAPIDLYVGGKEHACMHLIYARFITMFLYDIGFIDFEEPFKKVIHQGMILNNGEKMSKSKGNVVNLDGYDPDVIRFYLMFIGHYFDGGAWDDRNIKGITRFISKMKEWMSRTGRATIDLDAFKTRIFGYTEAFKFNKVVSSFMELLNSYRAYDLTKAQKDELVSLLEIYMPGIKNKIYE